MDPRSQVTVAIKKGTLKRQPCRDCGTSKVEAHHTDYRKPLEVVWLCKTHHHLEHKRLRDLGHIVPGRELLAQETILKLRVHPSLIERVSDLAIQQRRSVTRQARVLLEEALNGK